VIAWSILLQAEIQAQFEMLSWQFQLHHLRKCAKKPKENKLKGELEFVE